MRKEFRAVVIILAVGGFVDGCSTRDFKAHGTGTTSSFTPVIDTGKKSHR